MQEWDLSEDHLRPQIFSWHLVPLPHFALSPLQKGKSSAALNPDICSCLICYARMGSGAAKEIWCTRPARAEAHGPGALQRVGEGGLQVYSQLWHFLLSCTPGLLKWDTGISGAGAQADLWLQRSATLHFTTHHCWSRWNSSMDPRLKQHLHGFSSL